MTDQQKPEIREAIGRINDMVRGFMVSQVMFTANEGGIFALLEIHHTTDKIAAATGWNPRAVRMLLDGLTTIGLVEKKDGLYYNTPLASLTLVPNAPAYQGHIIDHMRHLSVPWSELTTAVQTGTAAKASDGERSPAELRAFILGMKDISQFSARQMLDMVDFAQYHHLLDLGAGPATYTITFLNTYPHMCATVFDRPEVIDIAQEEVQAMKLTDRVAYRSGDMITSDLGTGYDLVFISNIIHSFGPEKNQHLLTKCFDAMTPGGMLVVKDFLVDDDRSGPPFGLMFALNMLIGTGEGDTYTFSEVAEWTRAAGFVNGRAIDLTPQTRLWLTEKP